MPIVFNKVEKANPLDLTLPKKWYLILKTLSRLGEKDIAKEISDKTTLNRKEAEMALDQFMCMQKIWSAVTEMTTGRGFHRLRSRHTSRPDVMKTASGRG
jgi:hypothetical protein